MEKTTEKYIAKALEGYEANYGAISEAITGMEAQLKNYKEQQTEMLEGISEMKGLLGLSDEKVEKEAPTTPLTLVTDGTAIE